MFFALESFSQASINLTKQLQTISQALQTEKRILQERLLQSIQFELADPAEKQRGKTSELDSQKIAKLRQDVSELDESLLPELMVFFSTTSQYYLSLLYFGD